MLTGTIVCVVTQKYPECNIFTSNHILSIYIELEFVNCSLFREIMCHKVSPTKDFCAEKPLCLFLDLKANVSSVTPYFH